MPQEFLEEERSSVLEMHDVYFESLMREMLGASVTEEDLVLCRLMVMAPSLGVGMRRFARHARHTPHARLEFDPDHMAARMFEFASAGIESLRRSIEARGSGTTEGGE